MIESCTKKRMLLGITFLGGLTILVLIIESHWTDRSSKLYLDNFENNSICISGEEYEVLSECHPCTAFEIASESIGICVHARYKEVLKCKSGETITRSCDKVAWLEERTFWKFEGVMFALAVTSCLSIYWRENVLRQRIIKKVARQLRKEMHKDKMYEVYLSIYSATDLCFAPIETIVTLFTMKYCESSIDIKLIPSKEDPNERSYTIDLSSFVYEIVNEIPYYASSCKLPCLTINKYSCVSGLCTVLRQIIQEVVSIPSMYQYLKLLGFRFGSLKVSSEMCGWTKFCEVDLISTLKYLNTDSLMLPVNLARFECHMSKPIRLHNKHRDALCKKFGALDIVKEDGTDSWKHGYVEALHITLPDIIIFVCMHLLLSTYSNETIPKLVPLTVKWYNRMLTDQRMKKCIGCLSSQESHNLSKIQYELPAVTDQPLYNSLPKRCKSGKRTYTKQEEIDYSLQLVERMKVTTELDTEPFGAEVNELKWTDVPYEVRPESGHVPASRYERKQEQLQNLCKAVLKLAKDGDTIVDFCSGSGHLGILVAYLLPRCKVILMENKDKPMAIARQRVEKLKLTNVRLCCGNFNYFKLNFDIGMSLHACGVATDLVIQSCIEKNAIFICCPCCYGSVQNCHRLTYPRSDVFKKHIRNGEYLCLSHAADQTHHQYYVEENAKIVQGYRCMTIIDTDRKLYAEQFGYNVHLGKLIPPTCTPKNNLLVGIPKSETTRNNNCES